jgi:hypothetical protein
MHASVLLMVCLLALYVVAMVMCWHGLSGQQPAARWETAGRLALKEGQTIVSVVETAQGLAFGIGASGRDEKSSEVEQTR